MTRSLRKLTLDVFERVQEQFSKIAWRRVLIIAFVWTFFSMQSQRFRSTAEAIGYGVGHGGTAIILLSVIGAASTKKEKFEKDIES